MHEDERNPGESSSGLLFAMTVSLHRVTEHKMTAEFPNREGNSCSGQGGRRNRWVELRKSGSVRLDKLYRRSGRIC
ncbi:MAG: hypothetical protein MR488_06575 [Lachnospiraceae bacterium]|nr:hypothetical protein [Lachnospiraceae bacterium]